MATSNPIAVDTMAELRSLTFPASGSPCVILLGYHSPGDGGGGMFFWSATNGEEDGGTIIVPQGPIFNAVGPCWKRVYDGVVNVKWFGARGDDVTDDHKAINQAIRAAVALSPPPHTTRGGATVQFPVGFYKITEALEVIDDAQHGHARGVRLVGVSAGAASGGALNTAIRWAGDATTPMLKLWSRDCVVQHLTFEPQPNRTALCAIDVTESTPICTANVFEHCRFATEAQPNAVMIYGIRIGADIGAGFPGNCDNMRFNHCHFDFDRVLYREPPDAEPGEATWHWPQETFAAVYVPNPTGQAKEHTYNQCNFANSQYGLYYESGSFDTYSCGFTQHTKSSIKTVAGTDDIMIMGSQVEQLILPTAPVLPAGEQIVGKFTNQTDPDPNAKPEARFFDHSSGGWVGTPSALSAGGMVHL